MKARNKSTVHRTAILCVIALACLTSYYFYAVSFYASNEFKNPAGPNTRLFQKYQFTYDVFSLPSRMSYYLLPPDPIEPCVKYPLLVILHGGTGKAYAAGLMAEERYRNKYPGYILMPAVPVNHVWGDPNIDYSPYKNALPYAVKITQMVSNANPIDKGRVYVAGCSMGGGGSIAASLFYQDVFTAAAAMGAYFVPQYIPHTSDTPLLVIHGNNDEDAPVTAMRKTINILRNEGISVNYSEWENWGHNCPMKEFYPDAMWDWLYSQAKPRLR